MLERPLLTERMKQTHLQRCQGLLNDLKSSPAGRVIISSDEKTFDVDPVYNRRNDRYVSFGDVDEEVRTVSTTKHAAAAMALGLVASNGIVACRVRHGSVEATKRAVDQAWNEMDEDYVVKICSALRKRLTAIVEADGDRIE